MTFALRISLVAALVASVLSPLIAPPRLALANGAPTQWTVNTITDELDGECNDDCSLRDAIAVAASGDTIVFDATLAGGVLTLSLSDANTALGANTALLIDKQLTIDGSNLAQALTLSGDGARTIFAITTNGDLTLTGLTLRDGRAQGSAGSAGDSGGSGGGGAGMGGAIFNRGKLIIDRSTFTANSAIGGAGASSITLIGIEGGAGGAGSSGGAGGAGGATAGSAGGAGGFGGGGGGGASGLGGSGGAGGFGGGGGSSTPIIGSGLPGVGGFGGASGTGAIILGIPGGGGGAGMGGAIFNHSGEVTIRNSTFTGNIATGGASAGSAGPAVLPTPGAALGGALFNLNGTVTIQNSTFAGNSVLAGTTPLAIGAAAGGAIYTLAHPASEGVDNANPATLTLENTILADTVATLLGPVAGDLVIDQVTGSGGADVDATAPNLIEAATTISGTYQNSGVLTGTITLGPLTPYDGSPSLMPLVTGSPAIDAGDDASCLDKDQRGVDRPQLAACDLGAFELEGVDLLVAKDGAGSGNVTSVPAGINCGPTCNASLAPGTQITLTVQAGDGATFNGWSGACVGTGPCSLTVTETQTLTATFGLITHTLTVAKIGAGAGTVTSDPAGIDCSDDCDHSFDHGATVTLTATPDTGSTFAGWNTAPVASAIGACAAAGSCTPCTGTGPCVVTMDQAQTVTAEFTLNSYTLTVNKSGTGSGTVASDPAGIGCGSDCEASFDHDTLVTLTATANPGSTFAGWGAVATAAINANICIGIEPCVVLMDEAKEINAVFTLDSGPPSHQLTVNKTGAGEGAVTSDPAGINCGSDCSESYLEETVVTLTAAPAVGSLFSGWSMGSDVLASAADDCSGTGPCVVTMFEARAVTANFDKRTTPLAVNDAAATRQGMAVGGNVLANDYEPQGGALTVIAAANPANGAAVVEADGAFTYTPDPGFVGVDLFHYTIANSQNLTDTAAVVVVVEALAVTDRQPTAIVTRAGLTTTQTISEGGANLLFDLPAGLYSGTLAPSDVFYLVYTPVVTPAGDLDALPNSFHFAGLLFTLDAYLNDAMLDGMVFAQPLILTLTYDETALNGVDENQLTLTYWDKETQTWSSNGIEVLARDTQNNTLRLAIHHLSEFAFLGSLPGEQGYTLYFPWLPVNNR